MKLPERQIDTDVPVPVGRKGKRPEFTELYTMTPGQSIAVPLQYAAKLRNATAWAARTTGRVFTCQKQGDEQRTWCISTESEK